MKPEIKVAIINGTDKKLYVKLHILSTLDTIHNTGVKKIEAQYREMFNNAPAGSAVIIGAEETIIIGCVSCDVARSALGYSIGAHEWDFF